VIVILCCPGLSNAVFNWYANPTLGQLGRPGYALHTSGRLLGDGAGDFGAGIQYPLSAQYPYTVVEGDFNSDGQTDIVVGEPPLGITILYGVSGTMMPSGTPQNALLGQAFASPLAVTITDTNGNPVSGVTVTYSAGSAGAGAVLSSTTAVTNAAGVASITATANNTAGSYTVSANAGTLTAEFYLSNSADVPASLNILSGTPQSAAAGMPFLAPLKVVLKDSAGQPVSGATSSSIRQNAGSSRRS
jgi:hypothetical protein